MQQATHLEDKESSHTLLQLCIPIHIKKKRKSVCGFSANHRISLPLSRFTKPQTIVFGAIQQRCENNTAGSNLSVVFNPDLLNF